MSKRAVSFADSIETRTFNRTTADPLEEFDLPDGVEMEESSAAASADQLDEDGVPLKKSKHTLDSDEEDNVETSEMDMKKVEGQEDCDLDFDGNTKITAFNMKEDLEEGHFDGDGNFIYDKKDKAMKDAWLDDIDWASIKKKAGEQWEKTGNEEEDDLPLPGLSEQRRIEILKKLASQLKPGQTVAKALSQIKKKTGLSAAEERKLRWAAKKAGSAIEETDGQKEARELSGLADELLSAGHMEAYEWSRERIEHLIASSESTAVDELDMFSDAPAGPSKSTPVINEDDTTQWEYKEDNDAEIQGPFSSTEMTDRQQQGKLSTKGLARKNKTGGFNPVSRIDFDLYC